MVEAAAYPRQHIVVLFMTEEGPKSLDHRGGRPSSGEEIFVIRAAEHIPEGN